MDMPFSSCVAPSLYLDRHFSSWLSFCCRKRPFLFVLQLIWVFKLRINLPLERKTSKHLEKRSTQAKEWNKKQNLLFLFLPELYSPNRPCTELTILITYLTWQEDAFPLWLLGNVLMAGVHLSETTPSILNSSLIFTVTACV